MSADKQVLYLSDDLSHGGILEVPVNDKARPKIEAFLADEAAQPVTPRLAATVMMMRPAKDADSGLEVFMMQRASTMAFVPNAVVFPGGGMNPEDREDPAPWAGPAPAQWAEVIGCDEETARAIITTAVRELFEECGVLLASSSADVAPRELHGSYWAPERKRLSSHEISFAQFLREHELVLRSDLLALRAHWVTPEHEPRRYDTYFFTTTLPAGQRADGKNTESTVAGWMAPAKILHLGAKGKLRLVPPTIANLSKLAQVTSTEELMKMLPAQKVMLAATYKEDGSLVLRGELT